MSTLVRNKEAGFNFKIIEEIEAGLILTGQEVKSLKSGHGSLKGSFVSVKNNEAWIKKMYIPPYKKASISSLKNYNPDKDRKLLLNKKQIWNLANKTNEKGLTIIPISVYTTRRLIKLKIALVSGKKKFDKRETMKKRDVKRDIARKLKSY